MGLLGLVCVGYMIGDNKSDHVHKIVFFLSALPCRQRPRGGL